MSSKPVTVHTVINNVKLLTNVALCIDKYSGGLNRALNDLIVTLQRGLNGVINDLESLQQRPSTGRTVQLGRKTTQLSRFNIDTSNSRGSSEDLEVIEIITGRSARAGKRRADELKGNDRAQRKKIPRRTRIDDSSDESDGLSSITRSRSSMTNSEAEDERSIHNAKDVPSTQSTTSSNYSDKGDERIKRILAKKAERRSLPNRMATIPEPSAPRHSLRLALDDRSRDSNRRTSARRVGDVDGLKLCNTCSSMINAKLERCIKCQERIDRLKEKRSTRLS